MIFMVILGMVYDIGFTTLKLCPLVIEHSHGKSGIVTRYIIYELAIFHRYVKLPEGNMDINASYVGYDLYLANILSSNYSTHSMTLSIAKSWVMGSK